ncbi:MAG: hypothetical protein ACRC9T_03160, partial [Vibrionaceae bacterium]
MFPNQTPPTSPADTAPSQSSGEAVQDADSTVSTAVGAAMAAAANTTEQPETTMAVSGANSPPSQQRERRVTARLQRIRTDPYPRRPSFVLPSANVSAQAQVTTQPSRVTERSALTTLRGRSSVTTVTLSEFLQLVCQQTGLTSTQSSDEIQALSLQPNRSQKLSSLTLFFPDTAINSCKDVALQRLLRMINRECDAKRRALLILKAMRAFDYFGLLLYGTLTRLSHLLSVSLTSVLNWRVVPSQNEGASSTAASTTDGAAAEADATTVTPSILCLPLDVFDWQEVVVLLQEYQVIAQSPALAPGVLQASASDLPSMTGISFSSECIDQQRGQLRELMLSFNGVSDGQVHQNVDRGILFVRIICALQDQNRLPADTFERISLLLRTNSAAIAAWLAWFKESRADLAPSAAQAAALSAPPSP